MKWTENPATVRPMLATLADPPLIGRGLLYEPKYDGIRALVHVPPKSDRNGVRLWSRLGNDKTAQFPSIVRAFDAIRSTLRGPLLIDAEIVALDEKGNPAGFQRLQGRIHLTSAREVEQVDKAQPVAIIAFDLLRDGDDDLRGLPLTGRRTRLESYLRPHLSSTLRISEQIADDGKALHARALGEGWEGLIVKEAAAPYQSGRRSPAWRKLKVVYEQEFVVGGWTEPRQTRQHFGALLLGVHDEKTGALTYVGHTGTGFDQAELERVWTLLKAREIPRSPFAERPKTNETAHWVRPELVAQVKFTEWTADARLRHPVYLGLRDDKKATEVRREEKADVRRSAFEVRRSETPKTAVARSTTRKPPEKRVGGSPARESRATNRERGTTKAGPRTPSPERRTTDDLVAQLRWLEDARKDGVLVLPDGDQLKVTNLHK